MNDKDFVMPNPAATTNGEPAIPAPPRVLVADDDPASCRFLCDGMRQLGAEALGCADGLQALAHARREAYDLLLLDCRMPGAGARDVLDRLRADPVARSRAGVAVATSAELEPRERGALLAAGFSAIMLKPCTLADLRRVLELVAPGHAGERMLDDQAALDTSGNAATMRALRLLLREELAVLAQELDGALTDAHAFGERLHRLRASCGFCGATALATQAATLQRQLAEQAAGAATIARFRHTLAATLRALDA